MTKKVAVIGGGLSGLTAALALKQSNIDVVLYEAEDHLGGHIDQLEVDLNGSRYTVDFGSTIFLDTYSNIILFCNLNKISLRAIYFPLFVESGGLIWGQSGRDWEKINPANRKCLRNTTEEFMTFSREMRELYLSGSTFEVAYQTIGGYLKSKGYSESFIHNLLCPLVNSIFDESSHDIILELSLILLPEIWNYSLLSMFTPMNALIPQHGTSHLIDVFAQQLSSNIKLSTPVESVYRENNKVIIKDNNSNEYVYDEVIFSTSFDLTEKILMDATDTEKNIFKKYTKRETNVYVHTDASVLPERAPLEDRYAAFYNERLPTWDLGLIYFNRDRKLFRTTVNDATIGQINPQKIIHKQSFHWEKFTPDSLAVKSYLHHIQGYKHTWHCGVSTVIGFAECCFLSGLVIAEQLGAKYPFERYKPACALFHKIKNLMLHGETSLYLFGNY